MNMVVRLIRLPCLLALGALALGACSGGVVVDRGSTGAGGSVASSGGTNAGGAGVSSSAVQGTANSVGASSSGAQASASTSTSGGGGAGGGWPKKELCFLWDMDAGPCPPKEEAKDHMSMCGFSVYSVDDGPFVKDNLCCYTVSGVPNPC